MSFHVIRCGGIESYSDILESNKVGVSLNQWYTCYMHNYLLHGNSVYKHFFSDEV